MNCSQARTMLPAYRELKNGQMDTTALEVHLSTCAACRTLLTQSSLVGERLRALPAIEPPADAHMKIMKALAAEHARFIQNAPPSAQSTPIPGFLAPYLKEHAQEVAQVDNIAAFSTADTGPLPIIPAANRRRNARHPFQMNNFAVVGLAAAFLMVIMLGGLTSLVILASRGVQTVSIPASIAPLSPLTLTSYTTTTNYPYIVSAIANRQDIYYTAYRDTNKGWMLAVLDNETKVSTPLLSKESTSPLIVLSSSEDWLIWLQFDLPRTIVSKNAHNHTGVSHQVRTWSLQATYLGTDPATTLTTATPVTLSKGTFDAATAPVWINSPVPGTWLTKDTLLAATIDEKGTSHLTRYELSAEKKPGSTELDTAEGGHILTSPTANSSDTSIYWSEEWMTEDSVLHSTIWAQKITPAPLPLYGKWTHKTSTDTYQFGTDDTLFRPQVVNNTLFLLSVKTPSIANISQATPNATATATSQQNADALLRTNPTAYGPQPDEQLQGTLLTFSAIDDTGVQIASDSRGPVHALQAGSRFILWQTSDKRIGMYDVVAREPVVVGAIATNTTFLAVNGDTAVWTANPDSAATTGTTPDTGTAITFGMFNWPTKAPLVVGQ